MVSGVDRARREIPDDHECSGEITDVGGQWSGPGWSGIGDDDLSSAISPSEEDSSPCVGVYLSSFLDEL
jgi:hypothetical protein